MVLEAFQPELFRPDDEVRREQEAAVDPDVWAEEFLYPLIEGFEPGHELTKGELWRDLAEIRPPNLKSMGPRLQEAERRGLIKVTDRYRRGPVDQGAKVEVIWVRVGAPEPESEDLTAEEDLTNDPGQLALLNLEELDWWKEHWVGMPEFVQDDLGPFQQVIVNFASRADRETFAALVGQKLTDHGKRRRSIWFPPTEIGRMATKRFVGIPPRLPRYPVYVPTKGRHETLHTIRSLDGIGAPHFVVVEPQEEDLYAAVVPDTSTLLVLPHTDRGLVVTRNWIWDHAEASGAKKFWTMDDNIDGFFRLYRNIKTPVADSTMLAAIEDFVERYENVPIAGMNYFMFASRKTVMPPLYLNTRVYSNMLIETEARDRDGRPYRNEGFYNDDTDLCLRVLKDGWCTMLFNAFLILKQTTMTVSGGMTPHYHGDGRSRMAEELAAKHPDVARVSEKWGRVQHHVDYSQFKRNALRLRPDVLVRETVNDFGMVIQDQVDGVWVTREPAENPG